MGVPTDPRVRTKWLKAQLKSHGTPSLSALARELGIHRNCIYRSFERRYVRIDREIARRIGLPMATIWPERYGPNAKPLRSDIRPPYYHQHNASGREPQYPDE